MYSNFTKSIRGIAGFLVCFARVGQALNKADIHNKNLLKICEHSKAKTNIIEFINKSCTNLFGVHT